MPTLWEVLNRLSESPVDLWSFYVFMREHYGCVEYLEFWLDVAAHRALCKECMRLEIRRLSQQRHMSSDTTGDRSSSQQQVRSSGSPSSSVLFDMLREDVLESSPDLEKVDPPEQSARSAGEKKDTISRLSTLLDQFQKQDSAQLQSTPEKNRRPTSHPTGHQRVVSLELAPTGRGYQQVPSTGSPNSSSTFNGVRESAERIIATYLMPGAPNEMLLPEDSTGKSLSTSIRQAALSPGGIKSPRLFDQAAEYVFDALEREVYPAFLSRRALSNVQPVSSALRLAVGLLSLFGAFWIGFVFILLDWHPKRSRCWVILPFVVGFYLVFSSLFSLDPLMATFHLGERDGGGIVHIEHPYVKKLLMKRAALISSYIIIAAACMSVLFIFVPGYRL